MTHPFIEKKKKTALKENSPFADSFLASITMTHQVKINFYNGIMYKLAFIVKDNL